MVNIKKRGLMSPLSLANSPGQSCRFFFFFFAGGQGAVDW